MRAASIRRLLREKGVPLEKAQEVALRYGDESGIPTPTQAIQKILKREARKKLVLQRRREIGAWCKANGLPRPTFELQFAKEAMKRNWAWDISWPAIEGSGGVAIDVQGGLHSRGAHVRAAGYLNDVEKREAGETLGWKVLYRTWQNLYTDDTASSVRTLTQEQT